MVNKSKIGGKGMLSPDFLNFIPGHVYWKDRHGKYLGCNNEVLRTLHLTNQSEVVSKTDYDFLAKNLADNIVAIDQEIMASGTARVIEEIGIDASGNEAIYITKKTPLFDTNGKVTGLLGVSVDITNKKMAEQKIIEQHKRNEMTLENIINLMPGNIYWTDKNGVYLGCNDNQLRVLGLKSRSEFIGKNYIGTLQDGLGDTVIQTNQNVIKTGVAVAQEEIGTDDCGNRAVYLTNKVPLCNRGGEIVGLVGISINITDRKKAEEELKQALLKAEVANQAKTEFLENMRHDIRTPLSGIVGFADLLKETKDLEKTHEYADNLIASSHALLDFLNEVLEAIKVASGEIPLLKKKFDLKAKLSEVLKLNQAKAAQKNLKFFLDYYDKVPQYVVGDPIRLQRIFLELVNNALNFTHKGQVKTSVHLAKENGQDMVIKFVVEDTGIGIPEDKQQEVFTRFKRLTPSFQGIYKGAGLGLSIVKQFIDDLHGEIYVESKPGKGSTFTCIIPLQKALIQDNSGIHQEPATAIVQLAAKILPIKKLIPAKAITNGKSNILLVEDDDFAADITKTILESLGCNVKIAVNGEEAVKLTCSNHYDMLFMDIGLPDMDGYETTKRIRQCEVSKESSTPIIALSAHSGVDSAKKCIEAGMSAVLTKPLMHDKALDILNAFIPSRAKTKKLTEEKTKKSAKTAEQVVNLRAMKKDFDNKIIQSILELALKELPDRKKQFIAVYNKKDWELLRSLAHKMRGTAAYCRAERMHKACGELDDYLLTKKEPETITKLYNQALQEIETFGKYLKNFNKVKILSA